MQKFIVRCVFFNITKSKYYIKFYEEIEYINEDNLISKFNKEYKDFLYDNIVILSFQKMTHKELFNFSVIEYNKLFPKNVKLLQFKSVENKYFIIEKQFNYNNHEINYIRALENKGNKLIGIEIKKYDHDL